MFQLLEKILTPAGPSGLEHPAGEVIRGEITDFCDEVRYDAMGSLICVKYGTAAEPKKIMFSAHMDQIGYMVLGFEKGGYIRVMPVGGINTAYYHTPVVFGNGVSGILSCRPVPAGEKQNMNHLYIDIGAEDEADARSRVAVGDVAVYAPRITRLGEHRAASPAMDDRCACAMLVQLMRELGKPENTVIAVFSVQEEVGCRGAKTASFAEKPDIGIALDVTGWGDTPGVKYPEIRLGAGIAIKHMDRASISDPGLRESLISCAEKHGIPCQREILPYGGTDASAMQTSRGGIPVCTLSIPCRYVHSASEVVDLRDMQAGIDLMKAWLTEA